MYLCKFEVCSALFGLAPVGQKKQNLLILEFITAQSYSTPTLHNMHTVEAKYW